MCHYWRDPLDLKHDLAGLEVKDMAACRMGNCQPSPVFPSLRSLVEKEPTLRKLAHPPSGCESSVEEIRPGGFRSLCLMRKRTFSYVLLVTG